MTLAALLTTASARAGDEARAEALFADAKRAMTEGRLGDACPALRESQRLDPSGGTALLLAVCLERQGKLVGARAAFDEALAWARRDGVAAREALARAHLAALARRITIVKIELEAASALATGAELSRDGEVAPRDAWDAPWPVDPGRHEVTLRAPGRAPSSIAFDAGDDGATFRVRLSFAPLPARDAAPAARPAPRRERATAAWALGGAAVASSVVGAYFGLSARAKMRDVRAACPSSPCADADAEATRDSARRHATASTVAFSVAAALGAGALWIGLRADRADARVSVGGAF